jgi:hypothetical protein
MHARLAQIKEKLQICLSIYPYRVFYPLKYRFGIRLFRFHLANMPDVFILPADRLWNGQPVSFLFFHGMFMKLPTTIVYTDVIHSYIAIYDSLTC